MTAVSLSRALAFAIVMLVATMVRAEPTVDAADKAYALGKYDYAIQLYAQAGDPRATEARRQLEALGQTGRARFITGLCVLASVIDATVTIDGGDAQPLPLFTEIAAGKHVVVIEADGFIKARRSVVVSTGMLSAVSQSLDPQPAKLQLYAPFGANVHVDGEFVGVAPIDDPLDVEPGKRRLSVSMTGFEPSVQTLELQRGTEMVRSVDLSTTSQRIVAWSLVAPGAAGIATSIALGVVAVVEDRRAKDVRDTVHDDDDLSDAQLREIEDAESRRDDFRIASGAAAGVGLAVFVVGGALFILDEPELPRFEVGLGGGSVSFPF